MAYPLMERGLTPPDQFLKRTHRQRGERQRPRERESSLECGQEDLARRLRRGPRQCQKVPDSGPFGPPKCDTFTDWRFGSFPKSLSCKLLTKWRRRESNPNLYCRKDLQPNDLQQGEFSQSADSSHLFGRSGHELTSADNPLGRVVDAWPSLPVHIQETILVLVDAARRPSGDAFLPTNGQVEPSPYQTESSLLSTAAS